MHPEEHRGIIEGLAARLQPRVLPVAECRGLVLAEPVVAALPVPPFTNSAMDGFAVRFEDLVPGCTLPVSGDIPAGRTDIPTLTPGTAMRIMTGAAVPEGADTVVKVEDTDHRAGVAQAPSAVTFVAIPARGANIRHRGEALGVGELVLPRGRVLTSRDLAAAASVGTAHLTVIPRPRVVVVATGTELVRPGVVPEHGQIPDSNSLMLEGLVEEAGARVVARIVTGDDPDELREALAAAPQCDLVVTAGGISQGAYEVVRLLLGSTGAFYHVHQQPGGPQGHGLAEVGGSTVPVVCLPGNPVSVATSFTMYVAGLLRVMAGRATTSRPEAETVRVAEPWDSPARKVQYMPVRFIDEGVVPAHRMGSKSHLVTALADTEGFAVIPEDVARVEAGDRVPVVRILV